MSDDLISRRAAIDALRDWEMCYDWDEHCREEPKAPWVVSPSGVINKLPSAEPHWIPVTEDTPNEERECWITPKTTSKVYRGIFTRHYGECHRTGFICDDGFMWLNTALAWMYCEVPEPYKEVTE